MPETENSSAALDVTAIRARADLSTRAPWRVGADAAKPGRYVAFVGDTDAPATGPWIVPTGDTPLETCKADAEFIAHARTDIPALCDALDAQDAEIARLRAAGAWLVEMAQRHGAPMHVERFTSAAGYEGDYVSVESGSYDGPMGHGATLWDAIDDARAALEVEP